MDEQAVTQTIHELERKLGELERPLKALGSSAPAETPGAAAAPPPALTVRPPRDSAASPGPPPAHTGFGRIVDETVESSTAPESPGAGERPAAPAPADAGMRPTGAPAPVPGPGSPGAGERPAAPGSPGAGGGSAAPAPPDAGMRPTGAPAPGAPAPGAPAPGVPAPAPAPEESLPVHPGPAAPAARTPPPPRAATPPQQVGVQRPTSPGPAELLRFRERLERAARDLTHEYDELLGRLSYAAVPVTTGPSISFARGAPSLDIVDVEGLKEAAARAFESDPGGTTAYGTAIGYPRLRSWIADHHGVEPERVLVTNGSMQADAFLFETLVRPGDDVVIERPTYDRTLLSLRGRGAQLHAVQLEPDGINTEELGALLAGGVRAKLAHIIPNFQNPAGYTLSLQKRRRLLELAAASGFLVFQDDPSA